MSEHFLKPLFLPQSVAVFGATERARAVGQVVFKNLLESGFQGRLYAVNPKHSRVQDQVSYAALDQIGEPVDLAVVTTPAATVPGIMEACGTAGVRAAIIISAGFREIGAAGIKLERQVTEIARRYGVRFVGPNCLGIMRPSLGLNATFNKGTAAAGRLALVSQSGALCTAILDWAGMNDIGFSTVLSTGISADVDFGEILDFLAVDPQTDSIILYIEGISRARGFMSALRATARIKPVVVMKVGRHEAGSKAVLSHSGALVGGNDAFDAALRRAGALRVNTFGQVFAAAKTLVSRHPARGNRLMIITNGGGPGVMAADRAADLYLPLAELSPQHLAALDRVLPPTWSRRNPADLVGDADAARYRAALEIALAADDVDGLLVMLTPQAMTDPLAVAETVVELAEQSVKPVLTCWMGERQVQPSRELFAQKRIPDFTTPELAVEAFSYMADYYHNQQLLLQTPASLGQPKAPDVEGAQIIIESVLAEHRKVLSEMESKAILSAFHIPVIPATVARSPNEALVLAQSIGFPVAMKINSPDIPHKSDVGGVRLNLGNSPAIRSAFNEILAQAKKLRPDARLDGITVEAMCRQSSGRELIIGVARDPVFGPVITFGAGGIGVEVLGDRAVALPPLNRYLAKSLIGGTRIKRMLGEFRGLPAVNMEALEDALLRVSEMVCELPWLHELDINPLIADQEGVVAVDARIVVDYYNPSPDRYAHMAIHPYPSHLVGVWQLPDGTNITIRPIRPEDADIEKEFVINLSDEAKYFRFMQSIRELPPELLIRFTQIDYDREMAFVAVTQIEGKETELGVARYTMNPDGESCEFAIVVADAWQGRGLAHKLMNGLIDAARARGLQRMDGEVLSHNQPMLKLVHNLGFTSRLDPDDPGITLISKQL